MRQILDKDQVEALFSSCTNQDDVLVGLYRLAIPNWDEVKYVVDGKPHIGEEGWQVIYDLFLKFEKMHGEDVFPGHFWLYLGFSADRELGAWEVDSSEVELVFK